MKLIKTSLFALILLAAAPVAFGQGGCIDWLYQPDPSTNLPLRTQCGGAGDILMDGTALIQIFWDNNNNGPDNADVQPCIGEDYGCANWNTMAINGDALGMGHGYFGNELYFCITQLPVDPDVPRYYIEISTATVCWRSPVFVAVPGVTPATINYADWTCTGTTCRQSTVEPPDAPTSLLASDDALCMQVALTWQHNGERLNGFNIFRDGERIAGAGATEREAWVNITDTAPHAYTVNAFGAGGQSANAPDDQGRSFLVRFADGDAGNVRGWGHAGDTDTLWLQYPTAVDTPMQCPTLYKLFLYETDNGNMTELAFDSLSDHIIFEYPDDTTLVNLRVVLWDSSANSQFWSTDTTDSIFHLDNFSALTERDLVMPDRFDMAQNYPNPFNPETNIVFSVPFQSDISLRIYNIQGQLVRTLAAAAFAPGVHKITWDGLSDAGIQVGTGLYLYRLEGPGIQITKKMVMMK